MELYASGIYPKIFTRIDSLFKAGERTLGFLTKTPTCTLRDVEVTPCKAALGNSTRISRK